MSMISYGSVILNQVEVKHYSRVAVYNSTDYLYTRHTLTVRATFNPATQQDVYTGDGAVLFPRREALVAPPPARPGPIGPHVGVTLRPMGGTTALGSPGAYTAEVVKHTLLQPRLQLVWTMTGVTILLSPLPGVLVDSTSGPKPLSCDVVELHSGRTFMVDWTIQTDINECPRFAQYPVPVLSNQWSMSHDINEDFYTVRIIQGRAVFDAAVLRTPGLTGLPGTVNADLMRQYLMIPVPANMKREKVHVKQLEDGVTVEYQVMDKETSVNINSSIVTRVEASHSVKNVLPDPGVDIPMVGRVGADTVAPMLRSLWGTFAPKSLTDIFPDWAHPTDMIRSALATSEHVIHVKVWGTRNAQRNDLETFARNVITARIAPIKVPAGFAKEFMVTHDVTGTFVEAVAKYLAGPMLNTSGVIPTSLFGITPVFGPTNDTGVYLVANPGTQTLTPVGDNVSRGTYLESIVTAALTTACNPTTNLSPPATSAPAAFPVLPASSSLPNWPTPAPFVPPVLG